MSKGRSLIQYSLCTWVFTHRSFKRMKHNNQANPLYTHQHTYMYCMYTKIPHMYILHTKSIPKHTATSTHSLHTNDPPTYTHACTKITFNAHRTDSETHCNIDSLILDSCDPVGEPLLSNCPEHSTLSSCGTRSVDSPSKPTAEDTS